MILSLAASAGLVLAAALFTVVRSANLDERGRTDAIVVLGAAQYQGTPSAILQARLDQAAELYAEGVAPRIVTVGGNRPGDITTEGQAGKVELARQGIPRSDLIALGVGTDTLTSMQAVAEKMRSLDLDSATFVSDPAHMARIASMAKALGIEPSISPTHAGPVGELTPRYVIRETGGLLRFWFFDRWELANSSSSSSSGSSSSSSSLS